MGKESLKKKLKERQKRSMKNREKRGLGNIGFLDLSRIEGETPDWYKMKGGKDANALDLMPWVVTQDWYKKLRTVSGEPTGLEPGDWEYKLEVPVHRDIGLNNEMVLCMKRAFGKRCPMCDDLAAEYDKDKSDRDDQIIKGLTPSWRCVYVVYDYEDEESEDFKLWECSYHLFEKYYLEALEEQEDEELTPVDPEDGRIVTFKGRKKQLGSNEFFEAESIDFEERPEPYSDDIVEETIPLDSLLVIPGSFEEVQRLYLELDEEEPVEGGEPEEPEEPEEKPKKTRGRKKKERPEAAEVVEELDGVCPARGEWGKDCNQLEECSDCPEPTFEKCAEEAERLEKKEEKPKKTRKRKAPEKEEKPKKRTRTRKK